MSTDLSAPITNTQFAVFTAVEAGDNQTFPNVLVDTGSAYLWVGAHQRYEPGPDTQAINATFAVAYGSGYANGTAYKDAVTVGSATASDQIIGSASYVEGFPELGVYDGIFGLGPPGSNINQTSGYPTTPTFIENLYAQGSISESIFGLYVPSFVPGAVNTGEITFGGVDSSRFVGEIEWIPQDTPYNQHWNFNATSFSWGNITAPQPIFARTDCGALAILIPNDQLFTIVDTIPGTTLDESNGSFLAGCLIFPANMTAADLPPLEIGLGSLQVQVRAEDYIVSPSVYSALNITDDGMMHTYVCAGGPSFVMLGQKVLEHLYSAYDSASRFSLCLSSHEVTCGPVMNVQS
ncbi:acid protease [Rhodofomes roseus]|uniref:Acid protease n=1 Tax=Rhodofomes roseus TaxID=34475 RepID=A0ABQ8K424_9APHY|nr:acid protease [Rhodofomes roseus]KAH9831593.1 acid protease [Rhodofomes roseus]